MSPKRQVNHNIRKHFNTIIYNISRYAEIALSMVILLVIALAGFRLIMEVADTSVMSMDTEFFSTFLSQALSLVVGVEFVKMLCQHSAQTVVEVLMFATARQMVVEHLGPAETLLGVLSIAVLFAIRKYLMTDNDDMNAHNCPKNTEEKLKKTNRAPENIQQLKDFRDAFQTVYQENHLPCMRVWQRGSVENCYDVSLVLRRMRLSLEKSQEEI